MDKKVKILITVSCIIILIVIIALISLFAFKKIRESQQVPYDIVNDTLESPIAAVQEFEKVTVKNKYFAVERIINLYLSYLKQANGDIEGVEITNEIKQQAIEAMYNSYDKSYIEQFNISQSNLGEKLQKIEKYTYYVKEMYVYETTMQSNIYLVYGYVDAKEFNIMVKLDTTNMTFSILPQEYIEKNKYAIDMKKENIKLDASEIKENKFNKFNYKNIKDEDVAVKSLQRYRDMLFIDPNFIYESLDKEFKEKRFGSLEEFKKYIQINRDEILKIDTAQYLVTTEDEIKTYVCKDQYKNLYVFKENAIMDYTILLDDYTVEEADFVEQYNKSNQKEKTVVNLNKWIKMLNNRDYKTAYSYLNEPFRNSKFGSLEKFEQYMREKYPNHYEINYKNYNDESGISSVRTGLQDINNELIELELNINVLLKEDTNFEVSFEIE